MLTSLTAVLLVACGGGGGGGAGGGGGGGPAALSVATSSLPAALLDVPYSVSLAAVGGTEPYTWSLGPLASLPDGLSLTAAGEVVGAASVAGTYALDARVTDAASRSASALLDLSVALDVVDLQASPGPTRGSLVLRFTAPSTAGGPPVSGYVVRASVRHVESASDLAAAAVVPQSYAPGAPGTPEAITLTGLDPGQTLQVHLQTVQGGITSGFSYAVGGRVAEGTPPPPPPGAIAISAPGTLSTAGGYYLLTQDVVATGTAFTITARDVTLDLGGHRVTYGTAPGTAYGVRATGMTGSGTTTIRKGRILQGAGGGASCHGVRISSLHAVRVTGLDVDVSGTDADGISGTTFTGDVRVDHCTVRCGTTVVTNRHFPGVAAIRVDDASAGAEIDHDLVTASPQWGIRLQGDASSGLVAIHHDRVTGTKALVANGYMIGVYKRGADVFENDLQGESRGIHVASDGSDGIDGRIHDNRCDVQDQRNPEFPDFHWVHGIKVEGARGCRVYDNAVTGTADAQHAEVRAIDVSLRSAAGDTTGVVVEGNRVLARATDATWKAFAFQVTEGTSGACDMVVRRNVLAATDRAVMHAWDGGRASVFQGCALVRDLSLGLGHAFSVEELGNGGAPSHGLGLADPVTSEDPLAVVEFAEALSYDTVRRSTLVVRAVAGGAPVPGASVVVRDASSAVVLSGTTGADGVVEGLVTTHAITNGPAVAVKGPFSVSVSKAGVGSYAGTHPVTARTALVVDLGAATASVDATPPGIPLNVFAIPLSASRLLVRWTAPADASGIAGGLVTVDGALAAISDGTSAVISGLPAASLHLVTVQAVDRGGNASLPALAVPATTRPEDRGP
jgi:hypothetical protein